jgi:hypothetical protein
MTIPASSLEPSIGHVAIYMERHKKLAFEASPDPRELLVPHRATLHPSPRQGRVQDRGARKSWLSEAPSRVSVLCILQ